MKRNLSFGVLMIGIVILCMTLISVGIYSENNGVRVFTDDVSRYELKKSGLDLECPIEIRGRIEYRGDYIISEEKIVEFCDVKEAKKQMKKELRARFRQMKRGCK